MEPQHDFLDSGIGPRTSFFYVGIGPRPWSGPLILNSWSTNNQSTNVQKKKLKNNIRTFKLCFASHKMIDYEVGQPFQFKKYIWALWFYDGALELSRDGAADWVRVKFTAALEPGNFQIKLLKNDERVAAEQMWLLLHYNYLQY